MISSCSSGVCSIVKATAKMHVLLYSILHSNIFSGNARYRGVGAIDILVVGESKVSANVPRDLSI